MKQSKDSKKNNWVSLILIILWGKSGIVKFEFNFGFIVSDLMYRQISIYRILIFIDLMNIFISWLRCACTWDFICWFFLLTKQMHLKNIFTYFWQPLPVIFNMWSAIVNFMDFMIRFDFLKYVDILIFLTLLLCWVAT